MIDIYENGKVIGYTINLSKGGKITIYHGQNGASGSNGSNGQDGHTPVIGIQKDTDGIYYWTVDGSWLVDEDGNKVKAAGSDGQDGATGAPGQDGADGLPGVPGQDGTDGKDGVTPLLKIENGLWYVSYDDGATWTDLGQATGEQGPQGSQGSAGQDGKDGDSFFQSVNTANPDYVVFTLADGTQFKIPTWKAFEALQTMVNQLNSNIDALQAIVDALQNNDYVTSVTPITEGGSVVGYTINFSKSESINIFHGKDGADASAPLISVHKDTDGIYYWTVDGVWLLDEYGNKVKAEGISGVTPQFKIENGRWYVSYDNYDTWTDLGQATGDQGPEGPQGNPGQNGSSFFQSVTQDSNYVYITLSDGSLITLQKHPADAVTVTLGQITTNSALFNGKVNRSTPDLKVTVYYSTSSTLTVYKNAGKKSVTDFGAGTFSILLSGLNPDTVYYYFIETTSRGINHYSQTGAFKTEPVYDDEGTDMNPESGNM